MSSHVTDPESGNFSGYAVPRGRYRAHRLRGPAYFVILGIWILVLVLAMMALSILATQVSQSPTRYVCPPDCGSPPTGLPVATNPRFFAADGSFSVSYPSPDTAYMVTKEPSGITAEAQVGVGISWHAIQQLLLAGCGA